MLIQSDAARIPLPDGSVHCVVTSPPYWGLRKYKGKQGTGMFPDLGLEDTPDEFIRRMVVIFCEVYRVLRDDGVCWLNLGDCFSGGGRGGQSEQKRSENWQPDYSSSYKDIQQGNLMLMPHRVAIALQDDGWVVRNDVVWKKLNPMPESVAGWRWERERTKKDRSSHAKEHNIKGGYKKMLEDASVHQGINPDWLAEYEYGEGYNLRRSSWRHTRAHEFVFMMTKQMQYYSNGEAVRERVRSSGVVETSHFTSEAMVLAQDLGLHYPTPIGASISVAAFAVADLIFKIGIRHAPSVLESFKFEQNVSLLSLDPKIWINCFEKLHSALSSSSPTVGIATSLASRFASKDISPKEFLNNFDSLWIALPDSDKIKENWGFADFERGFVTRDSDTPISINNSGKVSQISSVHEIDYTTYSNSSGRNPRSVLDVPTAPYSGAHYATFPPALIAPLIRASCPRWSCPTCGQGWAPVVEKGELKGRTPNDGKGYAGILHGDDGQAKYGSGKPNHAYERTVHAYRPTCSHPHTKAEAVPGIVLDPFVGSGTTVMVAHDLLRRGIGLDISMPYLDEQAKVRTGIGVPANTLEGLPLFEGQ